MMTVPMVLKGFRKPDSPPAGMDDRIVRTSSTRGIASTKESVTSRMTDEEMPSARETAGSGMEPRLARSERRYGCPSDESGLINHIPLSARRIAERASRGMDSATATDNVPRLF